MSNLYVTCRRCSGGGSIETSQSEDGRFSYQDQCPECSSYGVVPASPTDILAAVRTLPGVEEVVVGVKYDAEPFMKKGPFFVDFDYEVASDLDPGRYLVVPLSEEVADDLHS